MKNTIESPSISGEKAHEKLVSLVKNYAIMMTKVTATDLGANQAATCLVEHHSKLDQTFLNQQAEMMLMPSNSCGNISNQMCDLFLGEKGAALFAKTPYTVLTDERKALHQMATQGDNVLLRFEIDRKIIKDLICFKEDISNITDFQERLDANNVLPRPKENELVIIQNSLCCLRRDPDAKKDIVVDLTPNVEQKALLNRLITAMLSERIRYPEGHGNMMKHSPIIIYDPEADFNEPHEGELAKYSEDLYKQSENGWISTHSFTTFFTKSETDGAAKPHQYQAYLKQHTLQQWLNSNRHEQLSELGVEGYVKKLSDLVKAESVETLQPIENYLFNTPKSHLATVSQMRVKYKATEVDPVELDHNLSEVQKFIDSYTGDTPEAKVSAYKEEAMASLKATLEASKAVAVSKQATLDSKGQLQLAMKPSGSDDDAMLIDSPTNP